MKRGHGGSGDVLACETGPWPAGAFWSAYCGNLDEAVEGVIDADPVASE